MVSLTLTLPLPPPLTLTLTIPLTLTLVLNSTLTLTQVVSLQLDEDKLVSVGRSGKLRVSRLRFGVMPSRGNAFGVPVERENCADLAPGDPTDLMRCVRQHDAMARVRP